MVMVTHNPDLECYANRILYIHNGLIEKQIINTYQCQYFPEEYQEKVNAKLHYCLLVIIRLVLSRSTVIVTNLNDPWKP